jgi:hypothetical protein
MYGLGDSAISAFTMAGKSIMDVLGTSVTNS